MSEKKKKSHVHTPEAPEAETPATEVQDPETPEVQETPETAETAPETVEAAPETQGGDPLQAQVEALRAQVAAQEEKYLRLCAEYDNYRKRTAKEKESTWAAATGQAAKAILPVYDNLERALKQETADEAYRKGVEMTMAQLKKVLGELGLEEIPALGQVFDANLHSAVMHVEDPDLGENIVKEVFQTGFRMGDAVVRYAMVVVAN